MVNDIQQQSNKIKLSGSLTGDMTTEPGRGATGTLYWMKYNHD